MIRTRRHRERGFTLLCLLMSLAIIGVLSESYLGTDTPGAKPWAVTQMDRTRAAVTMINTRNAQTNYFMLNEGRRPDLPTLQKQMDQLSVQMGGGGRFFVDDREQVHITTALPAKTFGEQFPLPKSR